MSINSPVSDTKIANMAIDILEDDAIDDIETATGSLGRFMQRNYAQIRDSLLEMYPWNFAKTREQLAATDAPAFGWDYAYNLPSDWIRMVYVREDGDWNGTPIKHEVESHQVLTNCTAPLPIVYIRREINPTKFSPLFISVLAARLALMAAQRVTGKASYFDKAASIYRDALSEAQLADTLSSGTPEPQYRSDVVDVRGTIITYE